MKKYFIQSCRALLVLNIIFWTVLAFGYLFTAGAQYWPIKILLFFEPLLFIITLVAVNKKNKIIYIFAMIFILINAILSLTDQIGLLDVFSCVLSLLALINLWLIRDEIIKK